MSSDDFLKELNLGMMLQKNFIQQALLELLLKGEAHIDKVSILVEPTVYWWENGLWGQPEGGRAT